MAGSNGDFEDRGGQGKMRNLDRTLDQPLGLEAERVSSMRNQKVSSSYAKIIWNWPWIVLAIDWLRMIWNQLKLDLVQVLPAAVILHLAFQSLGIVYGDLGASPLYVFRSTFPQGITNKQDVIGALSLIIYTVTFIPLIKYMFIVLKANDNGEGIIFNSSSELPFLGDW